MLYRVNVAVCSEINTKHINTVCGQNVQFLKVRRVGASSNQLALERLIDFGNVTSLTSVFCVPF
jgi:hypothetical protein